MNEGELEFDPDYEDYEHSSEIEIRGRKYTATGLSFCYLGGAHDGETFYSVRNGDEYFWISDSREGRFMQAFLPLSMSECDFLS